MGFGSILNATFDSDESDEEYIASGPESEPEVIPDTPQEVEDPEEAARKRKEKAKAMFAAMKKKKTGSVVEPVDTSSAPKETATTETRNEDKPEVSSEPVVPAGFKMIKKKVLNFNTGKYEEKPTMVVDPDYVDPNKGQEEEEDTKQTVDETYHELKFKKLGTAENLFAKNKELQKASFKFAGEKVEFSDERIEKVLGIQAKAKVDADSKDGLDNMLATLGNAPKKLTSVGMSRLHWDRFKEDNKIGKELDASKNRKESYLEKQAFLVRTDMRTSGFMDKARKAQDEEFLKSIGRKTFFSK